MSRPSSESADSQRLAGQLVVFTGKLSSLGRRDARALVERLGGETSDDVTVRTTMLVVGAEGFGPAGTSADAAAEARDTSHKLRRADALNAQLAAPIRIVPEDDFCRLVGLPTPDALRRQHHALRDLLARYRTVREDHLRYLVKCGVLRPVLRTNAETFFDFRDLVTIRHLDEELAAGVSFRSLVRQLVASRRGQLTFDFRLDAAPAKIVSLDRTVARPAPAVASDAPARDTQLAEDYFLEGSALDDGSEERRAAAAAEYRRALAADPYLVPALINLANLHYSGNELVEAQALYERAIGLGPDYFEAHFNLGNIHHDLGRFSEAQACYREALRLNPQYADAHFYLAVTFEKLGLSPEARPHWRAYRQLAPNGEWIALAKEFCD